MKKAILVGNGFSSYLVPDCKSKSILDYLERLFPKDFRKMESFFQLFRLDLASHPSPYCINFIESEFYEEDSNLTPIPNNVSNDPNIEKHIRGVLSKSGLGVPEKNALRYFFEAGLVYEIYKTKFTSMETPFKIAEMMKSTSLLSKGLTESLSVEIKKYFIRIFKNSETQFPEIEGITTLKAAKSFFDHYSTVFTTNYDLLLDSMVHDKVQHLHGGLNFISPYTKKQDSNLSNCYLVIGADFHSKVSAARLKDKESLLAKYYKRLSCEDFDEFHIFGYSGENDQHINDAIRNNSRIKRVVFFTAPDRVNDVSHEFMVGKRFRDNPHTGCNKSNFELRPWDDVWRSLR